MHGLMGPWKFGKINIFITVVLKVKIKKGSIYLKMFTFGQILILNFHHNNTSLWRSWTLNTNCHHSLGPKLITTELRPAQDCFRAKNFRTVDASNAWSLIFINLKINLILSLYPERCLKFNQLSGVSRIPNSQSKSGKFEI